MSIVKAFLFSLLALLITNFLFVILIQAIFGYFDLVIALISPDFSTLFYVLFCSLGHPIWDTVYLIAYHITNYNTYFMLLDLVRLIVPLIAAIVASRFGKKRINSFIGVFLTTIVSMVISIILMFNSVSYQIIIAGTYLGYGALFTVVLGSLLNGLIFGLIAFFTTKRL